MDYLGVGEFEDIEEDMIGEIPDIDPLVDIDILDVEDDLLQLPVLVKEELVEDTEIIGINPKKQTIPYNYTTHILSLNGNYKTRNNRGPPNTGNQRDLEKGLLEYKEVSDNLNSDLKEKYSDDIVDIYMKSRNERVKKFITMMNKYKFKTRSFPSICKTKNGNNILSSYINQYVDWASGAYDDTYFDLKEDGSEKVKSGLKPFDVLIISSDTSKNLQVAKQKGAKKARVNPDPREIIDSLHNIVSFSMLKRLDDNTMGVELICADYYNESFKGKGSLMIEKVESFSRMNGISQVRLNATSHAFGFYWKIGYRTMIKEFNDMFIYLNSIKGTNEGIDDKKIKSDLEDSMYEMDYFTQDKKNNNKDLPHSVVVSSTLASLIESNFKTNEIKNIMTELSKSSVREFIEYVVDIGKGVIIMGDSLDDALILMEKVV